MNETPDYRSMSGEELAARLWDAAYILAEAVRAELSREGLRDLYADYYRAAEPVREELNRRGY